MTKRIFDFTISFFGIIFLLPLFVFISLWIFFDSRGEIFYLQTRVGKDNRDFRLIKFRTMKSGSDKKSLLTVGDSDSRITRSGYFLRKYKLDELPQLFNVLLGDMSLVGPRPEVRKYVELYTPEQQKVLSVKPGITDYASIEYSDESELLAKQNEPEKYYIHVLMPAKLKRNAEYIANRSLAGDIVILLKTIFKISAKR